jgi:hypothetical protein
VLYRRILSLAVGEPGGEGVVLDGVRVRFNCVRTEKEEANTLELEVFNLTKSTRSKFETTDNRVVLQAGYATTGLKLLAIGDIVFGSTEYAHPEIITSVNARDGGRALRDARASVSYEPGVSAMTMVNDLVKRLDVDAVEIAVDLAGTFENGWSFVGSVRDGLNKLGGRFNFQWSVQNNTLQITEKRQPTKREAVYLSPSSGMVGSPSRIDKTDANLTDAKEPPGLRVECLLSPALVPGDPVVISSAEYPRGLYRITRVEHNGDTHGDEWTTIIEVVEGADWGAYQAARAANDPEPATT